MVSKDQQFRKWQWIKTKVRKASSDHRPQSHNIPVDTIVNGDEVSTQREWQERRSLINKLRRFSSFQEIENDQKESGTSLALSKPASVTRLEIVPVANPNRLRPRHLHGNARPNGYWSSISGSIKASRHRPSLCSIGSVNTTENHFSPLENSRLPPWAFATSTAMARPRPDPPATDEPT